MKYDRKNLDTENSKQTVIEVGSSERVYLSAGAIICALSLLFDIFKSESFLVTTGVTIGVLIAALNYRLWKIIVGNLIAEAVRRSSAEEKTTSPAMLFLLSAKLIALLILFVALFRLERGLVAPTLIGIISYILGGTLLILLISYNKR